MIALLYSLSIKLFEASSDLTSKNAVEVQYFITLFLVVRS